MSTQDAATATEQTAGDASTMVGSTVAGRYKVERLLGEGGMGAVYLVQHVALRKRLALKLLRPEYMRNPAVLARFEREAMAAAHLDHPNVAAASDYGRTDDERFFLVLEFVEGQELRDTLVKAGGPLPLSRSFFIARQIVCALIRAHELGIVHRDLKPENIMLVKRDGHSDFVKVLDFGLAQVPRRVAAEAVGEIPLASAPKLTQLGEIFGTPQYMAPEQSVGDSTDVRSDLYSVGIILYEMIAGTRPFTGKSMLVLMQQHLTIPPPHFSQSAPSIKVPKAVEALVQKLLAKSPEERFQTPQDLLEAMDPLITAHKLRWPLTAAAEASRSQERATGPRIPSLHRAWTAVRLRPATVLAIAKAEETLTALRQTLPRPLSRVPRWLPAGLAKPLQRLPLWLLLIGCVLLAGVPIGLAFRAMFDSDSETPITIAPTSIARKPAPAEVALALQSEFDAATAQGADALELLASRFPSDPRIRHAQVRSYTNQKRHADAMRAIAKLATIDPHTGRDAEVIQSIVAALNNSESMTAAQALLDQELGAAGIELLYDLTVKQTGARWKSRLNQSLTKADVLAKASPALRLAIDLRAAKSCEIRRDLLPRAQQDGDQRALTLLKNMAQLQGCGFIGLEDCWPCLRRGTALQEATAALESRLFGSIPRK